MLIGLGAFIWQLNSPRHVQVERQVITSGRRADSTGLGSMLAVAAKLNLSKTQMQQLELLQARESKELLPVEAELRQNEDQINKLSTSGKPIPLPTVQQLARTVSDLSLQKRQIQERYGRDGADLLTAEQRKQLNQMRKQKPLVGSSISR